MFPWGHSQSSLASIAYSEIFGGEATIVDRSAAMTIPSVVKARALLTTSIAGLPLRAYRNGEAVADQPAWMYRTDTPISPYHRMVWTLDDLIFHGWSLWMVARDTSDRMMDAFRVPFEQWSVDTLTQQITVNGVPVSHSEVVLIPGPGEGLLQTAQRSLNGAISMERAWVGRVQNPLPLVELHETSQDELTDDEIDELVNTYSAARTSPTGAVGYTPYNVQLNVHGTVSADLFQEGRNFSRLDIAAFFNLPGALLDASLSTASLTYSTQEGRRNEFLDYSIRYWTDPIAARLSLDDVVPRGQSTRFDLTDIATPALNPAAPVTED